MKLIPPSIKPIVLNRYISLRGESIVLATKPHAMAIIPSIGLTIGLMVVLSIALGLFFLTILSSLSLFFYGFLVILMLGGIVITKIWTEWYYHFYIVTDRKIVEYRFILPFSHITNDVLLNQVRCTEIDINRNGLIAQFFNIGDVMITFDRPTHQEEFVLRNIVNPELLGLHLGDMFDTIKQMKPSTTIWNKPSGNTKEIILMEDIPQVTQRTFATSLYN